MTKKIELFSSFLVFLAFILVFIIKYSVNWKLRASYLWNKKIYVLDAFIKSFFFIYLQITFIWKLKLSENDPFTRSIVMHWHIWTTALHYMGIINFWLGNFWVVSSLWTFYLSPANTVILEGVLELQHYYTGYNFVPLSLIFSWLHNH